MKVALVGHGDNPPYLRDLFNGEGFELIEKECNNEKEYIDLLKDADGALIYLHPLTTRKVMEQCDNLKVISRGGVGVDSVDLEAATELGICICNTPGINTTEVADHAMALLLSLTRKIREQDSLVKKGYWADRTELVHPYRSELGRIAGNVVGIVGLGNIGSYLYKYLEKNKKILSKKNNCIPNIVFVSAKNKNKKRKININKKKWLKNYLDATKAKNVDIIVELIGGSEGAAKKLVFSALRNKKHVVTANKALIAKYGDELSKIAEKNKVNLEFEASVCGGVPIIRSLKEGLIANKISKIYGIFNGTSNYILSSMDKQNKSFDEVLSNLSIVDKI